mmetsp:Transcript_4390/g.7779  ORF Transcript_4390/g.7779 Transcript_4390/m.7779 type:complete len:694 (-) Transcript_4390:135-2216(-)|eukprot:CAMPEP_0201914920 /NCGR_PEP_ID=MMETSP0903-20130614/4971_1 /ASSEMBLY_ACC=CAM_ASM_000552 /TAXON_ID=420261 /ORGANISM="Thalassiosira antarctica, Strain CCMP982" /LENGTH=693 /DNA_ID=CAMNT_0048450405 /DNA_START=23 /DNA_END=2104 /DNA_ORIENTATION=+
MTNRDESIRLCASCDHCRARKTRCDGNRPCSACKQRHIVKHNLINLDGVVDQAQFECFYSPAKRRGPVPGHKPMKRGGGLPPGHKQMKEAIKQKYMELASNQQINAYAMWPQQLGSNQQWSHNKGTPDGLISEASPNADGLLSDTNLNSKQTEKNRNAMITVPPGRLGLTLKIVPEGGAEITKINPACSLRGQVHIGDRIVTVDGDKVSTMEDVKVGKERARKFGIVKSSNEDCMATGVPAAAMNATMPTYFANDNTATMNATTPTYFANMTAALKATMPISFANNTTAALNTTMPISFANTYTASTTNGTRGTSFPNLAALGAIGSDQYAMLKRQDILAELLQYDKKNGVNTLARMNKSRYQVVCVPLKRKDRTANQHLDKETLNDHTFLSYNQHINVMDKFISAWGSYCMGTEEDAINMILFYLAKRNPHCFVKTFQRATKPNDKGEPIEFPPDFFSHDGTNEIKWNTRYSELLKHKEENGDCRVYTKSDLGKWVLSLRSARIQGQGRVLLTPKRVELLDNIGFHWSGLPEGQSRATPGGDPMQNRAIAAKLVYPSLTIRECLLLGGFQQEELDVVRDRKHTWRTNYVYHKDVVVVKVKTYDTALKSWARPHIEKLVNILEGGDEDRFEQVFGECSHLLSEFLEEANERMASGIIEKPLRAGAKRTNEDMDRMSDDEEQPAMKQAHVEVSR